MSNSIDDKLAAIALEKARHDIAVTTSLIADQKGTNYPTRSKENLRFWLVAVDLFGQEWCHYLRPMQEFADKCEEVIFSDPPPTYNQMINLCALRDVALRSAAK